MKRRQARVKEYCEKKNEERKQEHVKEYYEKKNEERKQEHIKDFYDLITFEKHEPLRDESRCTFGVYKNNWERSFFFHNCFVRAPNFNGYISEFKKKMEDNFEEGMSWENYPEWEIDHIVPLAKGGPHCVSNI